ncbi:MAG: hypothetical protein EOO56_17065 [Hymenobacter sp.]|nr:MAG: hypothetical protein EOO56_17065 [Hymenobacter sp.]
MLLTRTSIAYAVLALVGLTACKKEEGTAADAKTAVSGRVLMSPQEYFGTTGRQVILSFRDEGQYSCSNFYLTTQFTRLGQQLSFVFSGVDQGNGLCLTSIGPATSSIDVTSLPPGTYPLSLTVGNRQTTGSLELTSDYLRVQSNNSSIVAVSTAEVRFTPATAIWGHVIYSRPADQVAALAVADSLRRLGAASLTLPAGPYSRFTIDASGKPAPPTVLPGVSALPLLFTYTADFKRVKALITRAKATTPTLNMYVSSQTDAISN